MVVGAKNVVEGQKDRKTDQETANQEIFDWHTTWYAAQFLGQLCAGSASRHAKISLHCEQSGFWESPKCWLTR